MYKVIVNGIQEIECRSFHMAERIATKRKGVLVKSKYKTVQMPKSIMISHKDSASVKREIFREIYSENNKGYHFIERRR